MDVNRMIARLKEHHRFSSMGMIAFHLGIVRATSRKGNEVGGVEVAYDYDAIANIIKDIKSMRGIIEVLVETNEGRLMVGDEILAVAVAGDIREHVFPALEKAVDRIKVEASQKREF